MQGNAETYSLSELQSFCQLSEHLDSKLAELGTCIHTHFDAVTVGIFGTEDVGQCMLLERWAANSWSPGPPNANPHINCTLGPAVALSIGEIGWFTRVRLTGCGAELSAQAIEEADRKNSICAGLCGRANPNLCRWRLWVW